MISLDPQGHIHVVRMEYITPAPYQQYNKAKTVVSIVFMSFRMDSTRLLNYGTVKEQFDVYM